MQPLTRYSASISIPELVVTGLESSNLVTSVNIRGAHIWMTPSKSPMQIDFENLEPEDKLEIQVLDDNAEIGKFEMQLQDQFGKHMQGEFDKWFKLYIHESPTRVKHTSPSKAANSSFTRLYENEPEIDTPARIGRIRITMNLEKVVVAPSASRPKVEEVVESEKYEKITIQKASFDKSTFDKSTFDKTSFDAGATFEPAHRAKPVGAGKRKDSLDSPTPEKEFKNLSFLQEVSSHTEEDAKEEDRSNPSNRPTESPVNRPADPTANRPTEQQSQTPQARQDYHTATSNPRVKPRENERRASAFVASNITEQSYDSPFKSRGPQQGFSPENLDEPVITKELPRSPTKFDPNQPGDQQLANVVRESQDRLVQLQQGCPIPLDECPRCGYLEKLSVTQQNDLLSNEQIKAAYAELKQLMHEQDEEELKLPPHLKMEYGHRGDAYRQSIDPSIDDWVAVDIPTNLKYGSGGLNPQEAEHLRMIILGLNEKLKGMQMLQAENKSLRQQIQNDRESRKQLQTSMTETTQQLHTAHEKQVADNERINKERQNAVEALHQQHVQFKDKCDMVEQLEGEVKNMEAQLACKDAEKSNFSDQTAQIDSACKALNDSEDKRKELQNQFKFSIEEFTIKQQGQTDLCREQLEEIKRLQKSVAHLQDENDQLNNFIQELKMDAADKEGEISCLRSEVSIITDKEQQLGEIMGLAKDHEVGRQTLQTHLNEAAEQFREKLDTVQQQNKELAQDKRMLNDTLNEVENNLELKNEQISDLNAEKFELSGNVAVLEQVLFEKEDNNHMIDDVLKQNDMYRNIEEQLMKELDFLTDYLLRQADKTLTGTRMINKLKTSLDDKKVEIETLRNLATGFAKSRTYVPVSNDEVDEALAKIINTRGSPLDIGFAREGPGQYVFGTKQVGIFLENDRLLIRVGKGLMSFEEFVTTYTPIEQDRWEKKKAKNGIRHRNLVGRFSSELSDALKGQDITADRASRLLAQAFSSQKRRSSTTNSPERKTVK